jgi:hypothetical protein
MRARVGWTKRPRSAKSLGYFFKPWKPLEQTRQFGRGAPTSLSALMSGDKDKFAFALPRFTGGSIILDKVANAPGDSNKGPVRMRIAIPEMLTLDEFADPPTRGRLFIATCICKEGLI